jgi:alkaline phosphatase D
MTRLTRRHFGRTLLTSGGLFAASRIIGAPAIISGGLPQVANGVASGDISLDEAVIWSRASQASRMVVEWSQSEKFTDVRRIVGPQATAESDFTAKVLLKDLPLGQRIFYRVSFEDSQGGAGEAVTGSLSTPTRTASDVHFAWSGDTCGQGWGIDESRGGMRTYATIADIQPQFFVHSGDTIYADNPVKAETPLPDGSKWRNLVTEEKSKPAETLAEFRGNHRYNLLDPHVRRFNASVPVFSQWDDHEVMNNWYSGKILPVSSGYRVREIDLLAARSKQAFFEYQPIREHPDRRIYRRIRRGPLCDLFFLDQRSFRGPNSRNRQPVSGPETDFLGRTQLEWLKEELAASNATWKVICSDMPIGLMVTDGIDAFENMTNGDGIPLGRELELASLLRHLKGHSVKNVIWLTADVHYCASHYYNPAKAQFTEFDGFWEFVSGPLHAGAFGPNALDNTFGPEVRFASRKPGDPSSGPWTSDQFFSTVRIDSKTKAATVTHFNRDGKRLWSIDLEAAAA